jgi:hypothetical protein
LLCPVCGNNSTFHAAAVEYHTWLVDNKGSFLEQVGKGSLQQTLAAHTDDTDYKCTDCPDGYGKWEKTEKD